MSRAAIITLRVIAMAIAVVLCTIYVGLVLPLNENIVNFKLCVLECLGTYLLMTLALVVFPRIRKSDLAILCWAIVASQLCAQLGLAHFHLVAVPRLSQGLSGMMGIFSSILPMCLVNIRGDARERRRNTGLIIARKTVTSVDIPRLIQH